MDDHDGKHHLPVLAPEPSTPTAPPPPTRDQLRSRRKRAVRATSINTKRLTEAEKRRWRAELVHDLRMFGELPQRPRKRGECEGGERPCPFVSCKHHLYLDVSPKTGAIKLNFPDLEPHELAHTCVLDVADLGGQRLEEVGNHLNVVRERVRQIQETAGAKVAAAILTSQRARELAALDDRPGLPVLEEARARPGESIADELDLETFHALGERMGAPA